MRDIASEPGWPEDGLIMASETYSQESSWHKTIFKIFFTLSPLFQNLNPLWRLLLINWAKQLNGARITKGFCLWARLAVGYCLWARLVVGYCLRSNLTGGRLNPYSLTWHFGIFYVMEWFFSTMHYMHCKKYPCYAFTGLFFFHEAFVYFATMRCFRIVRYLKGISYWNALN